MKCKIYTCLIALIQFTSTQSLNSEYQIDSLKDFDLSKIYVDKYNYNKYGGGMDEDYSDHFGQYYSDYYGQDYSDYYGKLKDILKNTLTYRYSKEYTKKYMYNDKLTLKKSFLKKSEWDYRNPDYWYYKYPDCGKNSQSPINIDTYNFYTDTKVKSTHKFNNYNRKFDFMFSLNKHAVGFEAADDNTKRNIFVTIYGRKYFLKSVHFHWGEQDYEGSEHSINNEFYPLEMHMVHMNENGYFAVLAFLFKIVHRDNANLANIIKAIDDIEKPNSPMIAKFKEFKLSEIMLSGSGKTDLSKLSYYSYQGSFTTPPCTEGVYWVVYKHQIPISENQIKKFREISIIKENFRPIQPLNGRKISYFDGHTIITKGYDWNYENGY